MDLLSINNLSIGFSPNKILAKNIHVTLKTGQMVGLTGQNGVGKSTFIRTICGLQPRIHGEIALNGKEILSQKQKDLAKKISVVFTGKPESLNLTVLELITLGRHPYSGWLGILTKEDKKKIEEAISLMKIDYLIKKQLYELSDGQLQKVMIARSLAQETEIIILDEPTSHLDIKNKIDVFHLLKGLAKSGKSILISSHEIQLAAMECDVFWCMDFNKKMVVDTPHELITSGKVQEYLHIPKDTLNSPFNN